MTFVLQSGVKSKTFVFLTALSERDSVCKISNIVFRTRPLHSRCGNLVFEHQRHLNIWESGRKIVNCGLKNNDPRLSQTREVFVCHSSDPLVGVIKVDQQKLGMSLQFFFVLFGFRLQRRKKNHVYFFYYLLWNHDILKISLQHTPFQPSFGEKHQKLCHQHK